MKRLFSLFLVLFLTIALSNCGGGGGSSSPVFPPTISNLSYSPSAVYVGSGGGQVTISGTFTVLGANGGIASVTIAVLDSAGSTVSITTTPMANGSGFTSGTVQGSLTAGTTVAGNYSIRVTLTDLAGLTSNALTGGFRISNFPWVTKTAMPEARDFFAAATDGSLAYIIGGEVLNTGTTPGPASARVDIYNPSIDHWSTTASPMNTARIAPTAAVAGGVLYVIGGSSSSSLGDLSSVESMDLATGVWTTKTAMPTPRSDAAAVVVNGLICVIGGRSAGQDLSTTECYDPASDSWSTGSPMPTFRYGLGSDSIGGLVYAVGGYNGANLSGGGSGVVATVEQYDPTRNLWSSAASMSIPREYEAIVAESGVILAIGGDNAASRTLDSIESFNPSLGTWSPKTPMPLSLTRVGGVQIGGEIYIFDQIHTLQYTPTNDILW